jgi:hypothetical protein
MAKYLSNEIRFFGNVPATPAGDEGYGARPRVYRATIALDALQVSSDTSKNVTTGAQIGDTISLGFIPSGMRFLRGMLNTSVSLGTSTISIGNATTPAKYRAAAVFIAVDTETPFGGAVVKAAAASAAVEEVLLTVATAALPTTAGAKLVIDLEFMGP